MNQFGNRPLAIKGSGQSENQQSGGIGGRILSRIGTGTGRASDSLASVAREDWDRYRGTYVPLLREMVGLVDSPSHRLDEINRNSEIAGDRFDRSLETQQRNFQGLGLPMSANQRQSLDRQNDIGRAVAVTHAANNAGRQVDDDDFRLAFGGSGLRSRFDSSGGV